MRCLAVGLLTMQLLTGGPVIADEYFGEFAGELTGTFIEADPRPLFRLGSDFTFVDPNGLVWAVPALEEVDGASIPPAFWTVIGGPFSGAYIKASVIHDYYCEEKTRTEHDTHRVFYYGMRASGVEKWKSKFMYWAVATFGPKWKLERRITRSLACSTEQGEMTCTNVPKILEELVSYREIDLDDPEVLAVALSKASTVARTLKATDGEVLDVLPSGRILAGLEDIEASSVSYGNILGSKSFLERPGELGVLSRWEDQWLDDLPGWEGELPTYGGVEFLSEFDLRQGVATGFKLDAASFPLLQTQINLDATQFKLQKFE